METSEEFQGNEFLKQSAQENSFHDLEALEHIVDLIRGGHRLETHSWLRLLAEIHTLWPVSSKGHFRLWKVSDFPSVSSGR